MSPKVPLSPPTGQGDGPKGWTVLASSLRVNKAWEDLVRRAPENATVCYQHLREDPIRSIPRRVYPLRGKEYRGAWGYEVTAGDRVYYVPDLQAHTVEVYFAGDHPPKVPPPR